MSRPTESDAASVAADIHAREDLQRAEEAERQQQAQAVNDIGNAVDLAATAADVGGAAVRAAANALAPAYRTEVMDGGAVARPGWTSTPMDQLPDAGLADAAAGAAEAADAASSAVEAAGDAGDILGGVGEAIGALFDGLGSL